MPTHYDIIIVGGGFAGLATAVKLAAAGKKIAIIEKRPFLGGRAYSFKEAKTGMVVDNGQHLLMGCYHATREFLAIIKASDQLQLLPQLHVGFASAKHNYALACPNAPAPLHLLLGLLRMKILAPAEKYRAIKFILKLKLGLIKWDDQQSVTALLKNNQQSENIIQHFWEPLVLATINETCNHASAALLLAVLSQALLGSKEDSLLAIAKVGLSEFYVAPALKYLTEFDASIFTQLQINSIEKLDHFNLTATTGQKLTATQVILAIPPPALNKIQLPMALPLATEKLASSAIISVNLWYDPMPDTDLFIGIVDSPLHWVFNKKKYFTVIISAADHLAKMTNQELCALCIVELSKINSFFSEHQVHHSQVIREHQATFGNQVAKQAYRSNTITGIAGLYLAGDWTNTGLPGTIESAVQSGFKASNAALEDDAVR